MPRQQPTMEERFAVLETRVAELERQRHIQEDRDVALLARVDNFTDDLRRVERVQLRGFEEQQAHQEYVTERFDHIGIRLDSVENHLTARLDTVEDHLTSLTQAVVSQKEAIEALYKGQQALIAGQEQMLAILTQKPKTNA